MRLKLAVLAGKQVLMHRLCAILMGLVLAVVTIVVPASRTARALAGSVDGVTQQLLTQDASGQRDVRLPLKRCQGGAGMLSCSFYRPSAVTDVPRPGAVGVSHFVVYHSSLRGRSVAPPSRPPKSISA